MTTTSRLALAVMLCAFTQSLPAQTSLRRETTAYRGGTNGASERTPSRNASSGRRADPYQQLADAALAEETEWLAVDRDLAAVLNRERACAPDGTEAIKTPQRLQQETNAAKLEYYRQHRNREEDEKADEMRHTALVTARLRFLFLAAKIWRHAGRVGVSYSDHYDEKNIFDRLMGRVRAIAVSAHGFAPVIATALRC